MATSLNKTPTAPLQNKFNFFEQVSDEIQPINFLIDNFFPEDEANELVDIRIFILFLLFSSFFQ